MNAFREVSGLPGHSCTTGAQHDPTKRRDPGKPTSLVEAPAIEIAREGPQESEEIAPSPRKTALQEGKYALCIGPLRPEAVRQNEQPPAAPTTTRVHASRVRLVAKARIVEQLSGRLAVARLGAARGGRALVEPTGEVLRVVAEVKESGARRRDRRRAPARSATQIPERADDSAADDDAGHDLARVRLWEGEANGHELRARRISRVREVDHRRGLRLVEADIEATVPGGMAVPSLDRLHWTSPWPLGGPREVGVRRNADETGADP